MLQFACSTFATSAELLASDCACELDATDDALLITAILENASDMLAILSGGRIHGVCTKTVYPVGDQDCWSSVLDEGLGVFVAGVPLRGPTPNVTQVKIDGVVIDPSEYVIVRGAQHEAILVRIGSGWPTTINTYLGPSEVGRWSITYTFGRIPDYITKIATLELACELMTFQRTGSSSLPSGVVSANIQGASISLRDRAEALREGSEFIPAVARFLGLYGFETRPKAGVYSPDTESPYSMLELG